MKLKHPQKTDFIGQYGEFMRYYTSSIQSIPRIHLEKLSAKTQESYRIISIRNNGLIATCKLYIYQIIQRVFNE